MSRKKNIVAIVIGVLIVISIILGILANNATYRNITFIIKGPSKVVDIYQKSNPDIKDKAPKIKSASDKQVVKLKVGDYYYIPTGDTVDTTSVNFTVSETDKEQTITVISSYTPSHLKKLADEQMPLIASVLVSSFPSVMPRYEINNLQLIGTGDTAGVVLTPIGMDENNPDAYYRALLVKDGTSWKVIGKPEIVLTKFNTPNTSAVLLEIVNDMSLR